MSLLTLARRDALDPYRSRSLWVLLGLFAAVFGAIGYLYEPRFTSLSQMVPSVMAVIVPLAVVAFCYGAIAGPRESGSLRVLLSYPFSRREVVLGTFLGRTVVLGLATLVGLVAAYVLALIFSGVVPPAGEIAVVVALSLLASTSLVAIVVAISASVANTNRAAVLGFGVYLLFSGVWGQVPTIVQYVLNGFSFPTGPPPEWFFVWNQLNPVNAFRSATEALVATPLSDAVYHAPWFGLSVLVGWIVLSLLAGIGRFERVDL